MATPYPNTDRPTTLHQLAQNTVHLLQHLQHRQKKSYIYTSCTWTYVLQDEQHLCLAGRTTTQHAAAPTHRLPIHITGVPSKEGHDVKQFTYLLEQPPATTTAATTDIRTMCMVYKFSGHQSCTYPEDLASLNQRPLPSPWSVTSTDEKGVTTNKWTGWHGFGYGNSLTKLVNKTAYEAKSLEYMKKDEKTPTHGSCRWISHLQQRSRLIWRMPNEEKDAPEEVLRQARTSTDIFGYYGTSSELDVDLLLENKSIAPPYPPVPRVPPTTTPTPTPTTTSTSTSTTLNPLAYLLYVGQRDQSSVLSKLPMFLINKIYIEHFYMFYKQNINYHGVFAAVVAKVTFPPPTGININMMPIVIGNTWSIPLEYRKYIPLLMSCPINREEYGQIGYLTIHESEVMEEQTSQRRKGIHTESPGTIYYNPTTYTVSNGTRSKWEIQKNASLTVAWGRGNFHENFQDTCTFEGGLYMASNVTNSTKVWNCEIQNLDQVVDQYGGLEHNFVSSFLRHPGNNLQQGEMCWMTDRTPHASMPLKKGTKRSYFRLVTSQVSAWYEEHSTKNPYGVVPPNGVVVLKGSKFNGGNAAAAVGPEKKDAEVDGDVAAAVGPEKKDVHHLIFGF